MLLQSKMPFDNRKLSSMKKFFPEMKTVENFAGVLLLALLSLKDFLRYLHYYKNVNIAGSEYIYRETLFDQKLECAGKDR